MKVSSLIISSLFVKIAHVDGKCKIDPVDGHVDWPSNKKTIPKNAFRNCKLLRTISIPPEVKSIHNTAFSKSGLDLSELLNCVVDPSPLLFLKGPRKIERSVAGEPAVVLADPPIDYVLKFDIKLKGISDGWSSVILLTTDEGSSPSYGRFVPGIYVEYGTTRIVAYFGDDENGQLGIYSQSLELNKKSTVIIKVYGATVTISVNGIIESTRPIGTRSQLSDVKLYIGDPSAEPANAIISNISFDKEDVTPDPSLFDFKGPLQIERSVKGESAAVLAAPPTDYTLKFVIEPKGIIDQWGSIIILTTGDYYYPGYPYGTMVPAVTMRYGTTSVEAYIGYGEDGHPSLSSKPLEVDKKSKVVIEVYGTTATISVNGVIKDEMTIGTRSQLNDVKLYIGSPWSYPANATVSDISFG